MWRLLKGADVFLEGFRPGVIQRLGFDYKSVAAREPRLLYLSISGFGQTGPLSSRPAMDPVLQAYTGLMNENRGEDGIPHRVPVIVVDMSTALYAFQALSAALYARRDETRGRYIDVSLMQAATALQSIRLMACHLEGGVMKPGGAPGGVFKIADGWMSLLAFNDRDWRILCKAMQMPALADDPRFATQKLRLANDVALYAIVRPAIAAEPWAVWTKRLTEAGLMHERLNSYAEFLDQPHVRETGLIQWLTPGRPQPGRAGPRPARHAAPGRRHAARHGARHRPAHDGSPGRARLRRRRDRRAAGARHRRRRRMKITPARSLPHYRRTPWKNGGGVTVDIALTTGRRLALQPHADHRGRAVLRLHRLRPPAGPGGRPRPGAADARRRDRRASAVPAGALRRRDADRQPAGSPGRSKS